jgi:hypothetical protein
MIDTTLEERWAIKCDLCGKKQVWGEPWGYDEHIYPPDWTFTFCAECSKTPRECDEAVGKALEEYWARRKANEQSL